MRYTFDYPEPEEVKPVLSEPSRSDEQYQVFPARVVRVDYERKVVAIKDRRTQIIYDHVSAIPANSSSPSGTDVDMPEEGTACLAVALEWNKGSSQHVILCYIVSDTLTGQDAIAQRAISDAAEPIPVWTDRTRGVYRKAYPGQHTIAKTDGYTAKFDMGWDQAAMDYSRDQLDPFRRTRTTSTGRSIARTDHSLKYEGVVHRPQADKGDILPHTLPDGSNEWILYLNYQEKDWKTRYFSATQDMMPFVERVEKIQEFGLDYPVPHEIYETDMWDKILGTTSPFAEYPRVPKKDWWERTEILTKGMTKDMQYDDLTFLMQQNWDHPNDPKKNPGVGPTLMEGKTPRRRGWIIEKSEGTVVGSNMFDKATYGKVLKATIFPHTKAGRFGDISSGYVPITKYPDQVEAKLAASAWALRFPYEYNTTRVDISKEGLVTFEVGATMPKEKIVWDNPKYEHPHGAGRSMEGHFVGSVKLQIGKNRDEEESIDLQTTGGVVMRLGADDTALPDRGRKIETQIRGKKDQITDRKLQYWETPYIKLKPGDAGSLNDKIGAENVSLRAALDGGMFLRLGGRHKASKRRHFFNGYKDGPGKDQFDVTAADRLDSRSKDRPCYAPGEDTYRFHDITEAGKTKLWGGLPYAWSGDPTGGKKDFLGASADIHAVRDIFLRVGKNENVDVSATLDFLGSIIATIGKDKQGRSLIAALDGGIEMTIGENVQHKGVRLEIDGDVDILINGNLNLNVTGDTTFETYLHDTINLDRNYTIIEK